MHFFYIKSYVLFVKLLSQQDKYLKKPIFISIDTKTGTNTPCFPSLYLVFNQT